MQSLRCTLCRSTVREKGDSPKDSDTIAEPDISVIYDSDKPDDISCQGAPGFSIENLSPSTRRQDRLTKFNLYQQAGVREYWIVDSVDQSVQSLVLETDHYAAKDFAVADEKIKVNVFEDCIIDLTAVFSDL